VCLSLHNTMYFIANCLFVVKVPLNSKSSRALPLVLLQESEDQSIYDAHLT